MNFIEQPTPDYDYHAIAIGLPDGVTATIIRRSPHLPYEATVSAPDGSRRCAADDARTAKNWIIKESGLLADERRLARLDAACELTADAYDAINAIPDPGLRVNAALDQVADALELLVPARLDAADLVRAARR